MKKTARFEICCFTKQGSVSLSKQYRSMGYVPVSERVDADRDMHCGTYEERGSGEVKK